MEVQGRGNRRAPLFGHGYFSETFSGTSSGFYGGRGFHGNRMEGSVVSGGDQSIQNIQMVSFGDD